MFLILLGEACLLIFADVLLLKDFDSDTGADTVRTLDSENLRAPKILALSLTLTLSSLLEGGEGEPVITSLVLFSSDLLREETAKSSGLDISSCADGNCTEVMT